MGKSEVIMSLMEFDKIDNGQYDVEVKLNNAGIDITDIVNRIQKGIRRINEGANSERAKIKFDSQTMCLTYTSETLVPPPKNINKNKKKLLFILGNPATHSVENVMFFYSDKNSEPHNFWGKLAKTCLLENFKLKTREEEAEKRKCLILSGNTNHKFVIGFTTFYSLPTPTGIKRNPYCDSKGVEKLFKKIISQVQKEEYERIIKYDFCRNAILITTIKSAYNYLHKKINDDRVKCWPIRGKGSGWKDLSDILNEI